MDAIKFKKIIEHNRKHLDEATECARFFYEKLGFSYDACFLNFNNIDRDAFRDMGYYLFEIPIKDKEIGAMCYKTQFAKFVFLNSSIPAVNMNFAKAHEIYHLIRDDISNAVDIYSDGDENSPEEMMANQFAGTVLMPEGSLREAMQMLRKRGITDARELVCFLMQLFSTSYRSVVIRCYELDLFDDGEELKYLLSESAEDIRAVFEKRWLNVEILDTTGKDDSVKLQSLIQSELKELAEKDYLSQNRANRIQKSIQELLNQIKG